MKTFIKNYWKAMLMGLLAGYIASLLVSTLFMLMQGYLAMNEAGIIWGTVPFGPKVFAYYAISILLGLIPYTVAAATAIWFVKQRG